MRRALVLVLVVAGVGGCPIPRDDVFVGRPDSGFNQGCWQSSGAGGLVRELEGDVQLVLTPNEPGSFTFDEVALVSGGTSVEETVSEVEAVLRVTPDAPDTLVVITARLSCSAQWGDTASPELRFDILPSSLTSEWSLATSDQAL